MSTAAIKIPDARSFTTAPLRNRLRVLLEAPVPEVWALVGDLARFPEYSAGLERVDVKRNPSGSPTEYVCHFRPQQEGEERIIHRELIRWYEPNRGWASSGAEKIDAFGVRNGLHLVTVEPSAQGTTLSWLAHYDADDLDTNRVALDQALADIGANLVRRFGGDVIEPYVEEPQ